MFQGWQVGAIYGQAVCVCPHVCLLLANPYLFYHLSNHLHMSGQASVYLTVSLSVCLLTSVHLRMCVCVSLGLSGSNGLQQLGITHN